jgi:hypothetical protein
MKTIQDIRTAFGDKRFMTAPEIASALGLEPSLDFELRLRKNLEERYLIEPQEVGVNGETKIIYDRDDFEADEEGRVRGTPALIQRRKEEVKANISRLNAKHTACITRASLAELDRVADTLEEDEPSLKERWRRLRAAIEYEAQIQKKWEDRYDRN